MRSRRILYAALVGAAVLFQILFRFYLSTFVLVLILALPVLSLLLSLPGLSGVRLAVTPAASTVRCGEPACLHLALEHTSPLPLVPPRVRLRWRNQLTGEEGLLRAVPVQGAPVSLTVPAGHCGRLVCRVEGAWSCDLLGLFPLPLRRGPEGAVLVLPVPAEPEDLTDLSTCWNRGTVLRPRPGGGPGEDYDLRDYRPGDPLRSIHWKLSSKRDEPVVRETLEPIQPLIVVTYDHFGTPEALDRTFARLYGLSRRLLEQGYPHHIQWSSPVTGAVEDRAVDEERDLPACLEPSLSTPAPAAGISILDRALLRPAGPGRPLHLHVTPEGVEGGAL